MKASSSFSLVYSLVAATMLVAGNVALGYYYAPVEIFLTPVVVVLVTLLLLTRAAQHLGVSGSTAVAACYIGLHDAGIKLLGGGAHDAEGQGIIYFFLFVGLLLAYGGVVHQSVRQSARPLPDRLGACLLFPALMALHLFLFGSLGYGLINDCRYGCGG